MRRIAFIAMAIFVAMPLGLLQAQTGVSTDDCKKDSDPKCGIDTGSGDPFLAIPPGMTQSTTSETTAPSKPSRSYRFPRRYAKPAIVKLPKRTPESAKVPQP